MMMRTLLTLMIVLMLSETKAQYGFEWVNYLASNTKEMSIIDMKKSDDGYLYIAGKDESGTTVHYLSKYNSAGNLIWKKPISDDILNLQSITTDKNNQIILAGSNSGQGVSLKKLSSAGVQIWSSTIANYQLNGTGIACDNNNHIYIPVTTPTGSLSDTTFIKKINPLGTVVETSPAFFYCKNLDLEVNNAGEVFATGRIQFSNGLIVAGKIDNTIIDGDDPSWPSGNFLAKFTASFSLAWVKTAPSTSTSYHNRVDLDDWGNIYTYWIEKQKNNFSFRPCISKFSDNSVLEDSLHLEKQFQFPKAFLEATSMGVFVARNAIIHANSDDTVTLVLYDLDLKKIKTSRAFCDNIHIGGMAIVNEDAFLAGNLNDAGGLATFDQLNLEVYTMAPFAFDVFLAKVLTSAAMPLDLISFTGKHTTEGVNLVWTTQNEAGTSHFVVQRSYDALSFEDVEKVNAIGNGAGNYLYLDKAYKGGAVFYRLKMVDVDGRFSFSKVISISADVSTKLVKLFPNPAKNYVTIIATNNSVENISIEIFNAAGLKVKTIILSRSGSIPLNDFPAGVYYIRVSSRGEFENLRLLVQ